MDKVLLIPYLKTGSEIRFLIGRRPKNLIPDYLGVTSLWQFPTGKVGDNIASETVLEGALRELKEELGVERFRNFINNGYNFRFSRNIQKDIDCGEFHEHVFAIELPNKKIKLEEKEFEEYLLLDTKEANKKLFFNSHKDFLDKTFRDIQNNDFAKIFVICGPGGSGKGSVLDLASQKTSIDRAKTATTRKKEEGEDTVGRIFVSESEFASMLNSGDFIETNYFKGNYYGSLRREVEDRIKQGASVLIELDLNGLEEIKKQYSNVVSVFIHLGLENLKARMIKRGRDSEQEIEKRLEISKKELDSSNICDYVIENKDGMLENTVSSLIKIIEKEKGIRNVKIQ